MRPLALAFALVTSFAFFARADIILTPTNDLVSTVPRQELPALLTSTNIDLVNAAFTKLYTEGMTFDELAPIFKNPSAKVRLVGLDFVRHSYNSDAHAIDLMIPLLRDPDKNVRDADAMVLRSFTGQEIPEDQPGEWAKWWVKYRPYYELMERARRLQQTPQTGRDFHSRGCAEYDMGDFTNALVDFREACRLGSDAIDYSQCRLWLVQGRLGNRDVATKDLKTYLEKRTGSPGDWSAQIARYLVGDITDADLLKKALIPGTEPVDGQLCEAYFYIGSKDLVDGNKTAGTKYLKKCLATHSTTYEEYSSAQAALGIAVPITSKPSELSGDAGLSLRLSRGQGGMVAEPERGHGYIYYGNDWKSSGITETNRVDVLWSQDKTRIMAMVLKSGPIYESTNSGMAWQVFRTPGQYTFWLNGNETHGGFVATVTFFPSFNDIQTTNTSEPDWHMVAAAPNGDKVMFGSQNTPVLSVKYADTVMLVSWPSAFSGFVLQQNPNPAADWIDVTNRVATVSGQSQVIMIGAPLGDFFRLKAKLP